MAIESNHWVPSIGDPTIIGWVTVAIYFIVALICLKATIISKQNKSIKNFWLFLAFILIALGINKQLDLQTLFTEIGRNFAREQGWYQNRRVVQVSFIIFIGLIGTTSLIFLIKTYHNTSSSIKIALSGCIILFLFILIRASSFHHMDIFINLNLIGINMNGLFELGSLVLIGIGGFQYINNKEIVKL